MQTVDWVPEGVDLDRPNAARVYDYYLGGAHNFAVDRQLGDEAIAHWPELPMIMRANRAFLRRAVQYLAGSGIRQFLDLGSGIPTAGNVHEVARAVDPSCTVAYVDRDPIAVAHGTALLKGVPGVVAIQADLRDPAAVLAHPDVRATIDPDQPLAVLMVAVLHFVSDEDDPARIVAAYRDASAPGSALAICHSTQGERGDRAAEHRQFYTRTATPMTMRSRAQVAALLDGYDLVEPGLVYMAAWRPEEGLPARPEVYPGLAAVGHTSR
ncbi:SAM-dependent methyltransferase [Catenuloplanes japonicus]|uniref:SAM-dependent methyltransferase n=1 Tax=Catenuloplanes japonicus TaxID=33876 RepID=UPI000527862C|nr:SAM-dependent methyltransferase [Catenuloplanes japonicus]